MTLGLNLRASGAHDPKFTLKTTDLPITEIAIRSGFRKYDVFYKMFQKHIGMPPKTYRSQSVDAYAISGRI